MKIEGWKYYNHAMMPTTIPKEMPDMHPLESGEIWNMGGAPLLARWTTDWDCGCETNWWYVIKDAPFDIGSLKSNYRYKINKGCKYFDVRIIDPSDFQEELYKVQVAAYSEYPAKYRPSVDKKAFMDGIDGWKQYRVFGAFYRESNELVGYVLMAENTSNFYELAVQKANPQYKKLQLNAALVKGLMDYYEKYLSSGGTICDGARNVNHETCFQDYLEKYFGFRKAYCHLHIEYNPKIRWVIPILYKFRKILLPFDKNKLAHAINVVLKMEEICRSGASGE